MVSIGQVKPQMHLTTKDGFDDISGPEVSQFLCAVRGRD